MEPRAIEDARITRRGFVLLAGAAATGLALPHRAVAAQAVPRFSTEPAWQLPELRVGVPPNGTAPGYVVAAPFTLGSPKDAPVSGPVLLDDAGEPVWYLPLPHVQAQNLRVQTYQGKPVLTWYEGTPGGLYGGSCVIYDPTYHELKRVRGGHGLACDLHEFILTAQGTALLAIAASVPQASGPPVVEGIVQEVDVRTGRVLFEWHSLAHVPVSESFAAGETTEHNIDYFHLNSIDVDTDGHLLVSARHTSAVYKVHRRTGVILWQLGGRRSDFTFGPGAAFAYQHDVRRQRDGTLTVFDNSATEDVQVAPYSRAIRLRLDQRVKTASLVADYVPTERRSSVAMGNVQVLPDGGVFVGWGTAGGWTEFASDGSVRYEASFADGRASYRVLRSPWHGTPRGRPAVVLAHASGGGLIARVSWNGATEVSAWRLRGGSNPRSLVRLGQAQRAGFETVLVVAATPAHVAVDALDARGRVLGTTQTIAVS
jgi:hypothetical protein